MSKRLRIAHMAGSTATIQNSPALVTSNKARKRRGLPPITDVDGAEAKYDALRPQRLAAAATVYVEQFSAHPLEADSADLYGAPDGYIGADGKFSRVRVSETDKPVYEVELRPEDGLYPLPYMALQADGSPWEQECAAAGSPKARQGFYPDGSRSFEEIDRVCVQASGHANGISSIADVDFYRVAPTAGYTKGLPAAARKDVGEGDIPPEKMGREFFAYMPWHLAKNPPRPMLAKITNDVQAIADSGKYDGLLWTQGSPQVEEVAYWFNLLIDTTRPICCCSAQRTHGAMGSDGPPNIVDSLTYIKSRAWADADGKNRAGTVVVQEQQVFAAREVMKLDARPGGYGATGGHGGVLGQITWLARTILTYLPAYKHTHRSDLTLKKLPRSVSAVGVGGTQIELAIKDDAGRLLPSAIPSVAIVKDGGFAAEEFGADRAAEADLAALIAHKLSLGRLVGFVAEGMVPYGFMTSELRQQMMLEAVFSGIPVVRVGRGSPEGFADPHPHFIAGSNLTATKARMLLMAALMKFGSLPPARIPAHPTPAERQALEAAVRKYQDVFDTH